MAPPSFLLKCHFSERFSLLRNIYHYLIYYIYYVFILLFVSPHQNASSVRLEFLSVLFTTTVSHLLELCLMQTIKSLNIFKITMNKNVGHGKRKKTRRGLCYKSQEKSVWQRREWSVVPDAVETSAEMGFDTMEVSIYLGKSSFNEKVKEEDRQKGDTDWR